MGFGSNSRLGAENCYSWTDLVSEKKCVCGELDRGQGRGDWKEKCGMEFGGPFVDMILTWLWAAACFLHLALCAVLYKSLECVAMSTAIAGDHAFSQMGLNGACAGITETLIPVVQRMCFLRV